MAEPARSGREKQRYDGETRLVAGCLPVMPDGRVLLIGSVKSTDWILPKGGWEHDETSAEAAVREAYEEAGVRKEEGGTYNIWCNISLCADERFIPFSSRFIFAAWLMLPLLVCRCIEEQ